MNEPDQRWHLDKRINVSVIIAMVASIASGSMALGVAFNRIEQNETNISRVASQIDAVSVSTNLQAVQLGRIEENTRGLRDDMDRLTEILTRGITIKQGE
jgi:hypothetical protein